MPPVKFDAGQTPLWAEDHLHLRLFKIAVLPIDAAWNAQNVESTFWRFYLNYGSGAGLELMNGPYPLESGRGYFVPAGVRFHCKCVQAVRHFYVHFDVIGLPDILMQELFAAPIALPRDPQLEQAVQDIVDLSTSAAQTDLQLQCRVKSLLYEGLALTLHALPTAQRQRAQHLRHVLQPLLPAIERIERELGAALAVSQLAALCHLSENHFIRRFRECLGATPGQYIQERRIRSASQQLLFTEDTLETIAETCGFGNRFYFSRVFTRHIGISPAAYRKGLRR